MTTKQTTIFQIIVCVLIAVAFFAFGYLVSRDRFKVIVSPYMEQEKQILRDSLNILIEEQASIYERYEKLKNNPDVRTIVKTKIKEQKVYLNEKLQTYSKIGQSERVAMFHDLVKQLPPMPDSIR